MAETATTAAEALGLALNAFGKSGGFRKNATLPVPEGLMQARSVQLRAETEHLDPLEAARLVVSEAIDSRIEERLGRALQVFLQTDKPTNWNARDVTTRRAQAGAKLTSSAKPTGLSGRTWERQYELAACLELASAIMDMDAQIERREAVTAQRRLTRAWPLTLAVLPFRYGGDMLDEPLVDGFADDIISCLARVPGLTVISPTASRAWMLEADPLEAARKRADVDLVVSGAIRQLDTVLHVTLRIEETTGHTTRWAESFDLEASDMLAAQAAIAAAVLDVLNPPQTRAPLVLTGGDTTDPEAYELYLRGRGLMMRNTEADVDVALGLFDRAIKIDETFANAHAGRGYALWRQYFSGWAGRSALEYALGCVDRALKLDPSAVAARLTKVRMCWDLGWHAEGLREGQLAVAANTHARQARLALARALNNAGLADLALPLTKSILIAEPKEVAARKLLIWNLLMTGNYDDAAADGRDYLALNRNDANTAWAVAGALLAGHHYDEATHVCTQALRADPTDATLWLLKGYVFRAAGAGVEATSSWEEGAAIVSARIRQVQENERFRAFLANIHAALGDAEVARSAIERVEESQPDCSYLAYRCAGALAELKDTDGALQRLQRAITNGFLSVQLLRFEERFGFANVKDTSLYKRRSAALEKTVDALRRQYTPLVEALTASRNGGADDEEE